MTDNNNMERRQSFRLDMEKEMVDITWKNEAGEEKQEKIACLDFSKGGLKLECEHIIPVNTSVIILFKAANPNCQRLFGKVLRCLVQKNGTYQIALRLDDEAPDDIL